MLLKHKGLVKSVQFAQHRYLGDPINAVRLFNDLRADELIFFDIQASVEGRSIDPVLVQMIGDETRMPFTVGGGIRSLRAIEELIRAGAERVCINSFLLRHPEFIQEAADEFGSSTIVACIDVTRSWWGTYRVYDHTQRRSTTLDPLVLAQKLAECGVGEIVVQSVSHDGMMSGYALDIVRTIASSVKVPVLALGGCGSFEDICRVVTEGKASAAAAGSLFVYHGPRRAVLINFPAQSELRQLLRPT
ncbi:imidazole glycerol phosphate synthase subunit HisF [Microvirga sp. BT291]|nr:imidazole glycerol phosphate synthase subunit HisF [Microvirga pudoricolor]